MLHLKRYFFTGLALLLPLTMTVVVVMFVVHLLTNPFRDITFDLLSSIQWGGATLHSRLPTRAVYLLSQVLILIFLFLFTVLLGALTRWFVVRSIIQMSDAIVYRIPFVNKVYKTCKEVIHTVFSSKGTSFKRVVLVPFPNERVYALGLVSREAPRLFSSPEQEQESLSVFIPTTPNPTSGYILIYKQEDVIDVPLSPEGALQFVVSCGLVHPPGKEEERITDAGNKEGNEGEE